MCDSYALEEYYYERCCAERRERDYYDECESDVSNCSNSDSDDEGECEFKYRYLANLAIKNAKKKPEKKPEKKVVEEKVVEQPEWFPMEKGPWPLVKVLNKCKRQHDTSDHTKCFDIRPMLDQNCEFDKVSMIRKEEIREHLPPHVLGWYYTTEAEFEYFWWLSKYFKHKTKFTTNREVEKIQITADKQCWEIPDNSCKYTHVAEFIEDMREGSHLLRGKFILDMFYMKEVFTLPKNDNTTLLFEVVNPDNLDWIIRNYHHIMSREFYRLSERPGYKLDMRAATVRWHYVLKELIIMQKKMQITGGLNAVFYRSQESHKRFKAHSVGLQNWSPFIKSALCPNAIDLDLSCAGQVCALILQKRIDPNDYIDVSAIRDYVKDKARYRKELAEYQDDEIDEGLAKLALISILNGGKKYSIAKKYGIYNVPDFLEDIEKQLDELFEEFTWTDGYTKAVNAQLEKAKREFGDKASLENEETKKKYLRPSQIRNIALIEIEHEVSQEMFKFCIEKYNLHPDLYTNMFDGMLLPPFTMDGANLRSLINVDEISEHLQKKFNEPLIKVVIKEHENIFPECKPLTKTQFFKATEKLSELRKPKTYNLYRNRYLTSYVPTHVENDNTCTVIRKCPKTDLGNCQYLDIQKNLQVSDTIYVQSPMGTGKTYQLKKFLDNNQFVDCLPGEENDFNGQDSDIKLPEPPEGKRHARILVVVCRRSLGKVFTTYFDGFKYYEEAKSRFYSMSEHPRWTCQINSLWKVIGKVDYLILDEFSTIHDMIFDHVENKKATISALKSYIKNSTKVIVMDALLRLKDRNYVDVLRAQKSKNHVVNKWRNESKVIIYDDKKMLLEAAKEAVKQGLKIAFPVTSKEFGIKNVKAIFENEEIMGGKYSVYQINSDNSKSLESFNQIDFSIYNVILFTPTITAGVEIPPNVLIDKVFGYFTSRSASVENCIQMLGRARTVVSREYHICISDNASHPVPRSISQIENNYKNIWKKWRNFVNQTKFENDKAFKFEDYKESDSIFHEHLQCVEIDNWNSSLVNEKELSEVYQYIHDREKQKYNFRLYMFSMLKFIGAKIEYIALENTNVVEDKKMNKLIKEARDLYLEEQVAEPMRVTISNTELSTYDKYTTLVRKYNKTDIDYDIMFRYELSEFFKLKIDPEIIFEETDDPKFYSHLKQFEANKLLKIRKESSTIRFLINEWTRSQPFVFADKFQTLGDWTLKMSMLELGHTSKKDSNVEERWVIEIQQYDSMTFTTKIDNYKRKLERAYGYYLLSEFKQYLPKSETEEFKDIQVEFILNDLSTDKDFVLESVKKKSSEVQIKVKRVTSTLEKFFNAHRKVFEGELCWNYSSLSRKSLFSKANILFNKFGLKLDASAIQEKITGGSNMIRLACICRSDVCEALNYNHFGAIERPEGMNNNNTIIGWHIDNKLFTDAIYAKVKNEKTFDPYLEIR